MSNEQTGKSQLVLSQGSVVGALLTNFAGVVIALLVAFGLDMTAAQIAAVVGATNFAGVILTLVLWMTTVSRARVVEMLVGDVIEAGIANNQVPTGEVIRDAYAPIDSEGPGLGFHAEPGALPRV